MALSLKVSNSLEKLAASLATELKTRPGGVFQPDFIVTQTAGMNNWLRIRIAGQNGITANIRFPSPNDIVHEIYFRLDGPNERALSADHLQWIIYAELADAEFKRRFPAIASYYAASEDVKRLGLARRVGDLFDQYQVYRPEMISEWNAKRTSDADISWQAWLWLQIKNRPGKRVPDKTLVSEYILEALRQPENQTKLKTRLPRIQLFGLSILTAFHIDLFRRLGEFIDVGFFLLNPAPQLYWYDDRSPAQIARWMNRPGAAQKAPPAEGNSLLTNWGKVIRDTFHLLFRHEIFLDLYDDGDLDIPEGNTLLEKIQLDLFNNAVTADRQPITEDDYRDGSLRFNACYTPAREVEVLYNYLLKQVDEGRITSPRDIVVMVSDIDAYAPYVRAVFDSAPFTFPYLVADENISASDGFFLSLQAIMNLNADEFRAEEILQLLEQGSIRQRFGITDVSRIRKAVNAANIRFGIDGSEQDESVTVSWENGLKRIMYGLCMRIPGEYADDGYGFYPLDIAEGERGLELVRFCYFVECLISVCNNQKEDRPIAEWSRYLEESARLLLHAGENDEDEDYGRFREYLERMNLVSDLVGEPISFDVFRQNFVNQMKSLTRQKNFISGGITFCSLIPMRSIPFKTVALLGMNYDKFPRKETPVTFDIMKVSPQPGDRNLRDNDKHLFLETILSAKERLYISYIGRSVKDNAVLPPSALVDELLDYVSGKPVDLVTVHPLHGFSTRYSENIPGLYTYLTDKDGEAAELAEKQMLSPDFPSIDLKDFIYFFNNPVKAYYNKILGIYYRDDEAMLSETEMFDLNKAEVSLLKRDLVMLRQDELDEYRDKSVRQGKLPLMNVGALKVTETFREISGVTEMVQKSIANKPATTVHVELKLGDSVITGAVSPVYGDTSLVISFSKNDMKHQLRAWIQHLVLSACGLGITTEFISGNLETPTIYPGISQKEAKDHLTVLLGKYREGHDGPLLYSPDWSPSNGKTIFSLTETDFRNVMTKAVEWDPYLSTEHGATDFRDRQYFDEYQSNAREIFGPVFRIFDAKK